MPSISTSPVLLGQSGYEQERARWSNARAPGVDDGPPGAAVPAEIVPSHDVITVRTTELSSPPSSLSRQDALRMKNRPKRHSTT
jgi:hypothetical protein